MVLLEDATDFEGWEMAIDGSGSFAAAAKASDGELHVAFFDASGVRQGPEHVTTLNRSLFAPRIAMNPISGGGMVSVQKHAGRDAVY
jgi:hypothetical protein